MSGTATVLQQFVSGLKSRNEDTRAKSAKDLQHYVTTELREVPHTRPQHAKFTQRHLRHEQNVQFSALGAIHYYIMAFTSK